MTIRIDFVLNLFCMVWSGHKGVVFDGSRLFFLRWSVMIFS